MKISDLILRVDQLIEQGQRVLSTHYSIYDNLSDQNINYVNYSDMAGFRAAALSFITTTYPPNHSYYSEFDSATKSNYMEHARSGISILKSIKDEIEGGWLFSVKGLVSGEIFADFLEMADHLLSNNYKDAAAVIAGSVLEEHLRQLCMKNGIETEIELNGELKPKKADRMNSDLTKADIYNRLDQKYITTWLDLRNKAAHGQYNEYNKDQVVSMLQGITEFIKRVTL